MNLINKIKEKATLPMILLIIVIVNYLPLFINNGFTKDSKAVGMVSMLISFSIEIILLLVFGFKNKDSIKLNKKKIITLFVLSVILFCVQIKNLLQDNFYIMDIFNIGCICVNIFLLYILIFDYKIDEKTIIAFFKGIFWIGIVAVFWNLILFHKEILNNLNIIELKSNKYMHGIKGFFANRNSLAFFLNITLMSNAFLTIFEKEKNIYKFSILLLLFGIWCTYSKTGYAMAILFLELFFLLNDTYTLKKRLSICVVIGILGILGFTNIIGMNFLNIDDKKNENIAEEKIEEDDFKRLSGRTDIWKRGLGILNEAPINYIWGVGRFYSTNTLTFGNKKFTQFHNIYLEILLTGGALQLFYIGAIYFSVIKKIVKSNMNKIFKKVYIIMLFIYASYIMMESCGRFSIGAVDALCIIFFITIPLLHANSCTAIDEKEENKLKHR